MFLLKAGTELCHRFLSECNAANAAKCNSQQDRGAFHCDACVVRG